MTNGNILSLCDFTGNLVRPWAEAGWTCVCVDLKHSSNGATKVENFPSGGRIVFTHGNVMGDQYLNNLSRFDMVFSAPPCTDLAVSGARWFRDKGLPRLIQALTIVNRCKEISEAAGCPWALENPVSTISTYWRKPDYIFNPNEYGGYLNPPGDAYTKKTCLWTGGGFVMPERKPVDPVEGSKMHLLPPSEDRDALRSETPMGFARAVFEANGR